MNVEWSPGAGREPFIDPTGRRLLGTKTGIITELTGVKTERGAFPEAIVDVETADMSNLFHGDSEFHAGGTDSELGDALMAGIGEVVERYCTSFPSSLHDLPTTTGGYDAVSAEHDTVDFEYLDVFTDQQVEKTDHLEKLHRDTTLDWLAGTTLFDGDTVWAPSAMVTLSPEERGARQFNYCRSSTGTATGQSPQQAVRNAVFEIIERHEFMRLWCTQTAPRYLTVADCPELAAVKRRYERADFDVHFLYAGSTGPFHTVFCVQERVSDRVPKFAILGATSLDLYEAVEEAAMELGQTYNLIGRLSDLTETITDDTEFNDLVMNVVNYLDPDEFPAVEFLLDGPEVSPTAIQSGPTDYEFTDIVAGLKECGFSPVVFDLTTTDVERLGWHVCRVLVPECIPLSTPAPHPSNHPALADEPVVSTIHPYP